MRIQPKHRLLILLTVVVAAFSGIILFACGTSKEQQRQITNEFTPGKATQEAGLQTQPADPSGSLAPAAAETGFAAQTQPGTAAIPTDQPTMMITNAQGQSVVVTQTRAATQSIQAANTRTPQPTTQNPYPIASATVTRTATPKPTNTSTPTQIPTLQTGWAGEWVGYYEKADGSFSTGKLVVTLNGSDLTASLEIDNTVINYQGFVFNEGKFATGNMVGGGSQDSFWWDLLPGGQFRGTYRNKFAFCGSRQGINQPAPCLELPTS